MAWHDHVMLYETEQERRMEKKPVGQAYYPLAEHQDIQEIVFDPELANKPNPYMRPRPNDAIKAAPKKPAITQETPVPKPKYPEEAKMDSQPEFTNQFVAKPINSKIICKRPAMPKVTASKGVGGLSNPSYSSNKFVPKKSESKPVSSVQAPSKLNFKPTFD